jgi:hypothetical protein
MYRSLVRPRGAARGDWCDLAAESTAPCWERNPDLSVVLNKMQYTGPCKSRVKTRVRDSSVYFWANFVLIDLWWTV